MGMRAALESRRGTRVPSCSAVGSTMIVPLMRRRTDEEWSWVSQFQTCESLCPLRAQT
jgi:hypothetical protein